MSFLVHALRVYRGSGGVSPLILNLGANWRLNDQRDALDRCTPGKNHVTHRIGGWEGPGAGIDVLEKRKFSCLYRNSNTGLCVPQPRRFK